MPLARSSKYPNLRVFHAKVQFRNGEAEVTEQQAAKLRKLPKSSGVTVEAAKSAPKRASGGADS